MIQTVPSAGKVQRASSSPVTFNGAQFRVVVLCNAPAHLCLKGQYGCCGSHGFKQGGNVCQAHWEKPQGRTSPSVVVQWALC